MESSSSRNGETPIRQSCDRCHSQKLRCTRASTDNTGACARCLTKHVQCIYSFSLPKGRPSVYNLAEKSAKTANAARSRNGNGNGSSLNGSGTGSRNSSKNGSGSGSGDVTESDMGNTASSDHRLANLPPLSTLAATTASSQTGSAGIHADDVNGDDADLNTHSSHQEVGHYSIFYPKIGDNSTDEPWTWPEGLRWEDLDVETPDKWSGLDSNQATFNWHAFMDSSPAAATSASASASASASDSDNTACLAAFPGLMDWTSTSGDMIIGQTLPSLHEHSLGQGLETSHSEGRTGFSTSEINDASSSNDSNDPGVVIAQLSQLSIRLSRLHQSCSCPPKDYDQNSPKPVIDHVTVQLVATWLVHGSAERNRLPSTQKQDALPPQIPETKAAGNVLYHLFSASKQLLDILRRMQGSGRSTNNTSFSNSTTHITSPAEPTKSSPHFTPNTGSKSPYSRPSNHHLHNVIHYLLIACYTTLLNIYVSVLKALEHDANIIDHTGAPALGDIGLVSIVQLCSYLTARQHQAIGMYLSTQSALTVLPWQEDGASDQGFQLYPDAEMRGLKAEVQRRLARLQQTLCF